MTDIDDKNNYPINTLFMLMSLDGKINSGDSDFLDVDRDWIEIDGVKEGLGQYYDIEKTTDWYSLNTGRVMAKIGVNERTSSPIKIDCRFIIVDNKPHLTECGVKYLCKWVDELLLVTNNKKHPAYNLKDKFNNIKILYYDQIDFKQLMSDLKINYNVDRITIQSGGTLNCELLREGLIDYVNIVIAPLLVGGKETSTLIDGESIHCVDELKKIRVLELVEVERLNNSYVQLKYKVINNR